MKDKEYSHHTGLEPFCPSDSRILILGSFPSVLSRKQGFYYMNPLNRFYKVLASVFKEEEPQGLEERKDFLKRHHFALSDVVKSCDIIGSKDASIKNAVPNDFHMIFQKADIKVIFNTGRKSFELYEKFIKKDALAYMEKKDVILNNILLPSPSPLNASYSLEKLEKEYQKITLYTD